MSSSLLSHPSVGSFLPSLAMPSMSSLLSLLEGLLYPEILASPEDFEDSSLVDLAPTFSAEDARVTSVALHGFLHLSLKFPFVLRKLFFFSSSRSRQSRRDLSSPSQPSTSLQGAHGLSSHSEGDTNPLDEEGRVSKRQGISRETRNSSSLMRLTGQTPTFIPFERTSRGPEGLLGEEEENEEMERRRGKEWTSSRRATGTSAGRKKGENKKRDEEIFISDQEERNLLDEESGEPLVVLVLCGLLQDDVWECLDDLSRWNSLLLVRLVLLLARGTTPSDLLPSVVGATGKSTHEHKAGKKKKKRQVLVVLCYSLVSNLVPEGREGGLRERKPVSSLDTSISFETPRAWLAKRTALRGRCLQIDGDERVAQLPVFV